MLDAHGLSGSKELAGSVVQPTRIQLGISAKPKKKNKQKKKKKEARILFAIRLVVIKRIRGSQEGGA